MEMRTKRIPRWIHPVDKPEYAGIHIVGDFWGCKAIDTQKEIEEILREAARRANNTILQVSIHKFEPQGITGVVLLAESHISIHTWPEIGYIAVDAFTCGRDTKPWKAVEYLQEAFAPTKTKVREINRGEFEGL